MMRLSTIGFTGALMLGMLTPAWADPRPPIRTVAHARVRAGRPYVHRHYHRRRPYPWRRSYFGFGPRFYSRSYFGFYGFRPWYRPYFGPSLVFRPRFYSYPRRYYFGYPAPNYYWNPYCSPVSSWYTYSNSVFDAPLVAGVEHRPPTTVARDWLDVLADHVRERATASKPTVHFTSDLGGPVWKRELAEGDVESGDRLFREGLYLDAFRNYERAAESMPDSAIPHIRQGYALVAVKRFAQAAAAFRRALQLDPRFLDSGFASDELYGTKLAVRTEHVEGAAAAALDNPRDTEVLFVIGVMLRLEGDKERAQLFFRRATDPDPEPALHLGSRVKV